MSREFNHEIDAVRALAGYGGAFEPLGFEAAAGWQGEVGRGSPAYVSWVQHSLNQVLGRRLAVDGQMGPQTRSAIRSFQQKKGLTTDGVVGAQTEAALVAAGAPPPGTSTPAPAQTGVIDPRIDVHAQRSLQRLLKSERAGVADLARSIHGAVKGEGGQLHADGLAFASERREPCTPAVGDQGRGRRHLLTP
ncbi:MAG TPA: peptidoglycan-binding domain-containing protein [Pyrinomonadaceae bacterium]